MTDPTPSPSVTPANPGGRPPRYALMSLVLFGLTLTIGGFATWDIFCRDTSPLIRRGPAPLTAEWQGDPVWTADEYLNRAIRCDMKERGVNEAGREYEYHAVAVGPGLPCIRDDGISPPVFAVALGDSFTFGMKVAMEHVWTERLEKELGRDVVNLGVPGTSPTQYVRMFERIGADLRPQWVIVTLFANDWLDEACFQAWWRQRQRLGAQVDFPRSNAIYESVRRNAFRLPPDWRNPPVGDPIETVIGKENYRFETAAYAAVDRRSPTIDRGCEASEQALLSLRDKVGHVGASLIVVVIPAKEFVYHEMIAPRTPYAAEVGGDIFCKVVSDFCERNKIACLDMLPILRGGASKGEHAYFPRDGHFREEGNAMLAAALQARLKSSN